jgi:hypothetical protein
MRVPEHANKIEIFCDKFTTLISRAQKNQLPVKANWLIYWGFVGVLLVGRVRFERTTIALKVRCSTG